MLDPWGSSGPTNDEDYERIKKEFGIEEIDEVVRQKLIRNRFIRRKIIFGHRDLGLVLNAIEKKQPWAVMSGIKPSGPFHLGTSTTALEIIEFQKMGGKAYYCIADIESWEDNGITYKEAVIRLFSLKSIEKYELLSNWDSFTGSSYTISIS
ncbi:unnamed protein product [marine sediment metagenome]|uniref:Tryptophanyl-tRNA synthetase n=1 Tax=marine sediment metagenome TaxID=412755 RepID=X1S3N8_9ZZZZ